MNGMMPFLKPSNVRQNSLTLKLKYTAFSYKIFILIKLDILKMLVFESNNNLENIYSFFPPIILFSLKFCIVKNFFPPVF